MKKIVVLLSGHGSNLQALIEACDHTTPKIAGKIVAVFSNNPQAYGLQRARHAGIPAHFFNPNDFPDRASGDAALTVNLNTYQPDLIVLAGYMRILSPAFVAQFHGRILNIHPSLLPKYPGLHTHRRAITNRDREHGTTVHFVTDTLDGGPIILQARVPILTGDTEETLARRVQGQEHHLYPLVVSWLASERLTLCQNQAYLDGSPIDPRAENHTMIDMHQPINV